MDAEYTSMQLSVSREHWFITSNELKEGRMKVFPLDTCIRGMNSVRVNVYDDINASHMCAGTLAADPAICHVCMVILGRSS